MAEWRTLEAASIEVKMTVIYIHTAEILEMIDKEHSPLHSTLVMTNIIFVAAVSEVQELGGPGIGAAAEARVHEVQVHQEEVRVLGGEAQH